jgi:hypothetical protein
MPLVILHHLLNVFVQLANKRGLKKIITELLPSNSPGDFLRGGVEGFS